MIEFKVEMAELKKKVNFVRNGLGSSKTDLPVLLMRFEITGKKATLFAANKELFARTEVKIARPEEAQDGTFAILGSKMIQFISQVDTETAEFKADSENLEVRAGFLTVNFETYDGSSLKTVEHGVQDHLTKEGLVLPRFEFEEAFVCAKACTTTNSIRPDVTHAELRKGFVLSSDGRKVMTYTHKGFPEEVSFKCPSTALSNMIGALKNIEAEKVQVIEGEAYYYVKGNKNEYTFGVRKVERSFPAIEGQVAAAAAPTDEISIDQHTLEALLKGVALGLPSDEVKITLDVAGEDKEAFLETSAVNNLGRRSHERASCGRKGKEKLSFPISFKHLLETLAVFKGDSVVDLLVMTKLSLLIVKDSTEAREVLTIIPFRTDQQIEQERKEREAAEEARKKATKEDDAEEEAAKNLAAAAAGVEDSDEDLDLGD